METLGASQGKANLQNPQLLFQRPQSPRCCPKSRGCGGGGGGGGGCWLALLPETGASCLTRVRSPFEEGGKTPCLNTKPGWLQPFGEKEPWSKEKPNQLRLWGCPPGRVKRLKHGKTPLLEQAPCRAPPFWRLKSEKSNKQLETSSEEVPF